MTDPVPSKDLCSQLRALPAGYRLLGYTAAEEIERLRRPAHEREPPHCPTCECWKADAQSAPEPAAERCKHGNPIDPTGSYVCLKCFNEPAGFCCDINASHPGKHRDGCPAQPPGDAPTSNARQIAGMCCAHGVPATCHCAECCSSQVRPGAGQ
jgi:hypothetical protein